MFKIRIKKLFRDMNEMQEIKRIKIADFNNIITQNTVLLSGVTVEWDYLNKLIVMNSRERMAYIEEINKRYSIKIIREGIKVIDKKGLDDGELINIMRNNLFLI